MKICAVKTQKISNAFSNVEVGMLKTPSSVLNAEFLKICKDKNYLFM